MGSLQYVCMWTEHGWKRTTIEEADRIYPFGTVSAKSGLLLCELCGQYVTLTDKNIRGRYFKHSRGEEDKNCPNRTFAAGQYPTFNEKSYDLPIKIVNTQNSSFYFEMGFIRVPSELLASDFKILISSAEKAKTFTYSSERINEDGITYLKIGDMPCEKYHITIQGGNSELKKAWPSEVKGIDCKGTLFEKNSGHKLPYDADVQIGKEYYLLSRYPFSRWDISRSSYGIRRNLVSEKTILGKKLYLYVVLATDMNNDAARFFHEYHCRLTDQPMQLKPVWPLYAQGSYVIKHNCDETVIHVKGNVFDVKAFPKYYAPKGFKLKSNAQLYRIKSSGRQQLISIGRSRILKYIYFWKEPIGNTASAPNYKVTDIGDNIIEPGENNSLPPKGIVRFYSRYDGEIIVKKGSRTVDKRKVSAETDYELDKIVFGTEIEFRIGLDSVWKAEFKRKVPDKSIDDTALLRYVANSSGELISVPHSLRNIGSVFEEYPKLSLLIKKCIKAGVIHKNAFRKLQKIYIDLNNGSIDGGQK